MGAEDDFRKVAEDVRELARTLRSELRAAKGEARHVARDARDEIRREYRSYKRQPWGGGPTWHQPRHQWSNWYAPPDADAPAAPYGDAPASPYGGAPPAPGQQWSDPTHYPSGVVRTYGAPPGRPPRPPRPPAPPRPPKPAKPPRREPLPPIRHRRDGSTLLSLLLVLIGLAWLATQTKLFAVPLEAVLAAALALLGAAMVVTARTDWSLSRRRWPVWVGAVLLITLLSAASSHNITDNFSSLNFGPMNERITSWPAASTKFENFAGPVTLDLTSLSPGTGDETITVRDVFGPVTISLPQDLGFRVHVESHAHFGPQASQSDWGDKGPLLTLDMRTVFGPVNVEQTSKPTPAGT